METSLVLRPAAIRLSPEIGYFDFSPLPKRPLEETPETPSPPEKIQKKETPTRRSIFSLSVKAEKSYDMPQMDPLPTPEVPKEMTQNEVKIQKPIVIDDGPVVVPTIRPMDPPQTSPFMKIQPKPAEWTQETSNLLYSLILLAQGNVTANDIKRTFPSFSPEMICSKIVPLYYNGRDGVRTFEIAGWTIMDDYKLLNSVNNCEINGSRSRTEKLFPKTSLEKLTARMQMFIATGIVSTIGFQDPITKTNISVVGKVNYERYVKLRARAEK